MIRSCVPGSLKIYMLMGSTNWILLFAFLMYVVSAFFFSLLMFYFYFYFKLRCHYLDPQDFSSSVLSPPETGVSKRQRWVCPMTSVNPWQTSNGYKCGSSYLKIHMDLFTYIELCWVLLIAQFFSVEHSGISWSKSYCKLKCTEIRSYFFIMEKKKKKNLQSFLFCMKNPRPEKGTCSHYGWEVLNSIF